MRWGKIGGGEEPSAAMERCKCIWKIQGKSNHQIMTADWMCDGEGEELKEGPNISGLGRWVIPEIWNIYKEGQIYYVGPNRPI